MLEVTLSSVNTTWMQAVITNRGTDEVNLLNNPTIIGDVPIRKVFMWDDNGLELPFTGLNLTIPDPPQAAFWHPRYYSHLAVNESLTVQFDAADEYDLSAGGRFTAIAHGSIPYAPGNSTTFEHVVSYHSNSVELTLARDVTVLFKRTDDKCFCDGGDRLSRLQWAMAGPGGCLDQARRAASDAAAEEISEEFAHFFHTDEQPLRDRVSKRFRAIANECASGNWTEQINSFCEDLCNRALLFASVTEKCHDVDLAGVTIHELSRLSDIFDPATQQYSGGWPGAAMLPANQAVENADTYRLYAQTVYRNCPIESPASTPSSTSTQGYAN